MATQTAALAAVRNEAAAQAEIVFSTAPDGHTYISHQRVGYPFHITRPFHLDREPADLLSLYLQSVSGGIYESERIAMTLTAEANTGLASLRVDLDPAGLLLCQPPAQCLERRRCGCAVELDASQLTVSAVSIGVAAY